MIDGDMEGYLEDRISALLPVISSPPPRIGTGMTIADMESSFRISMADLDGIIDGMPLMSSDGSVDGRTDGINVVDGVMEGDLDEGAPYERISAAGKMEEAEDDVGLFVILSCERKANWF